MRTPIAAGLPHMSLLAAWGEAGTTAACPATRAESSDVANAPETSEADGASSKVDAVADKPAAGAPASDEDVTAILQLVVNDPELDNYLHLGEPGRFPLQLAGERLPSGL